jgi:hypothetical protein
MLPAMRCLVVVRHRADLCMVALKVSRSAQGLVSCAETVPLGHEVPGRPAPGMTWWSDGRYRLTTADGIPLKSRREAFSALREPECAYRMPAKLLVRRDLPLHEPEEDTEVLELPLGTLITAPEQQELHVCLGPAGQGLVPEPDTTVLGEWPVLAGEPGLWIALYDFGERAA